MITANTPYTNLEMRLQNNRSHKETTNWIKNSNLQNDYGEVIKYAAGLDFLFRVTVTFVRDGDDGEISAIDDAKSKKLRNCRI